MAKFMVIARGDLPPGMSPADMQRVLEKYMAWGQRLGAKGKLDHGNKLKDREGRVVGKVGGEKGSKPTVTDGPYAEAKEIIGGYWILEAKDYAEAMSLVVDSPHLEYGTLEVRAVEVL
ncbi:MAG: YciI family protein [Rhodospirillaceae bacterium]|nr:YciI family protein [Rhodospirillaceae bacterium]